ncbi:hypothetical protein FE257_007340 [Aspergillus nanangensis]|uniref:Wax synthase domain-containing protein n=1 Tax=Aspergillus nanangensis TaxID=2582783 RepID=A0AAD4GVG3_ASPNN|nr:hypothetical protein FE257_007340 [Aspergillus nanangensis]
MTDIDSWTVSLATWGLAQLVTGLSVALIPPQSSLRSVATAVVIVLASSFQSQVNGCFEDTRIGGPLAAMCWVNVLNAIDLLVLSRVSYDAQRQWDRKEHGKHDATTTTEAWVKNLIWSQTVAFNYRRIGTPWQIRGLPTCGDGEDRVAPSRGRYLLFCALKVVVSVVVVQLFTVDATDPYLGGVFLETSDSKVVLVPGLHWVGRRMLIRVLFTISFAVVCRFAILGGYNLTAVIAVGAGIHDPADWPPISNALTESWSLRRLTGWHQLLRRLLTSNAEFLTRTALRIPRRSSLAFPACVFFTFFLSGLFHTQMDLAFGVPIDKSGAIYFFTLQGVGMILETAVQDVFRERIRSMDIFWKKAIGYVWVGAFLLWTLPVWLYPINLQLYRDGQRLISPFLLFPSRPL